VTDASGAYAIAAPRGTYSLSVDRRTNVVTPASSATAVVTSESDTTVGFVARPYVTVSGVVTDGAGGAVHDVVTGAAPALYAYDSYAGVNVPAALAADGVTFT